MDAQNTKFRSDMLPKITLRPSSAVLWEWWSIPNTEEGQRLQESVDVYSAN